MERNLVPKCESQKKYEKPLDKPTKVWYNKYVIKGGDQNRRSA